MNIISRFRSLSLTAKLFLLLLPLATVPFLAVMAQWYFITRSELAEEAKRGLEARWTVVERELTSFIGKTETRIQEISESPLFADLFGYLEYGLNEEARNVQGKIAEYFIEISAHETVFRRICVSYSSGLKQLRVVRGALQPSAEPVDSDKCPRPQATDGSSIITGIKEADDEIQQRFLRFTMPLRDRWRAPWAQLTFDIPFSEFSLQLAKLPLPDEGAGLIIDERGRVVACSQGVRRDRTGDLCASFTLPNKFSGRDIGEVSKEARTTTIDGHVVVSRRMPMEGLAWTAVLLVTTGSYEAQMRQLEWSSLIAGTIFFMVAVCALLPLSRRATAPLRRLEEFTLKIASGDFQQKLPFLGRDEIGRLASAFNAMAHSLTTRDARLRKQAASLAARNEELTALNKIMSRATMSLKLDELLPGLLDQILSVMSLKAGAIRLVDEAEGTLRLAAHRGLSKEYEKMPETIRIGESITGKVAVTGEPVFIEDAQTDPAAEKLLMRVHSAEPLRCFAAVPIVAHEKIIGVLSLGATGDRTFRQTDLSSLHSIGLGIGACIQNARLYQDLDAAYKRLRTIQDHLIQVEKLSALGQLIAGVAHEINNPLTAILGFSQLVQARLTSPDHAEEIEIIITQTERCARVVKKLLAFARETEKREEELDLAEVMKDALDPAKLSLSLHNIEVSYNALKGECIVLGDRYQLQQVFLNIITNAQDAMEDLERPRLLKVDIRCEGSECVVKIADNGHGMAPEVLRKVFDPFYTTKARGKGTGLGLSLSYGIIKDHGGDIAIESQTGAGTTVKISLPRVEAMGQEKRAAKPTDSWRSLSGRHILVVEDELTIRNYLGDALSPIGVKLTLADSLGEARKALREATPDLILVDVRLPDGDGFLLYEEVTASGLVGPERFAFMSGDIASEKTRERLEKVVCPHIQKPFGIEEICQFLCTCVEGDGRAERKGERSARGQ